MMVRFTLSSLALALSVATGSVASAQSHSESLRDPVVQGVAKVADQIKLPAKEAGVLVHLAVKEGEQVRAGQQIGKIDDSQPQIQKRAASAAYQAAYRRWKDEIELKYAEAAAAVAEMDYQQIVEANKQARGAVTAVEERAQKLVWDKLVFAVQKAHHDREIAMYEAATKKAEYDAAELAISRCVITASFDGVVEEIHRKQDEWVTPGDTILVLNRLDTMHLDAAVNGKLYDPHELQGCEVTVEVELARGRKEQFRGRITKISSVVRQGDEYHVRAEVANRQENGIWILRDRLPFTMTIHLNTGGTADTAVTRAQ